MENSLKKLERLEELIPDIVYANSFDKELLLAEFSTILENNNLDLNNDLNYLLKPLIVTASIWASKEIIELLLKKKVDVFRTINLFHLSGLGEEESYNRNKEVTCLELLQENKSDLINLLNTPTDHKELDYLVRDEIAKTDDCILLFENYIKSLDED